MIAADLDVVNMFGNAEWPAIREALEEHMPEALAWTNWQQSQASVTTLPSGSEFSTDRGAEQGDVFGSVQSALTLGKARARDFATPQGGHGVYVGACDQWYIDDGQAFVQPQVFDAWLRAVDRALLSFGATRGRRPDDDIKSSCRLVCPLARRREFAGWDTAYVHSTTNVLGSDSPTTALGAPFGPVSFTNETAKKTVDAAAELRESIIGIDHAPTELVLTRQCADVSKLLFHLRLNGDRLDMDIVDKFDQSLRNALEATLGGDLPDTSWWQATTGVAYGGLGLRTARSVALSAFVASRITSRPLVRTMVGQYSEATGAAIDTIMLAYDKRTEDAIIGLVQQLPPDSEVKLTEELTAAAGEADLAWQAILNG